jgi:hypothetical protein
MKEKLAQADTEILQSSFERTVLIASQAAAVANAWRALETVPDGHTKNAAWMLMGLVGVILVVLSSRIVWSCVMSFRRRESKRWLHLLAAIFAIASIALQVITQTWSEVDEMD